MTRGENAREAALLRMERASTCDTTRDRGGISAGRNVSLMNSFQALRKAPGLDVATKNGTRAHQRHGLLTARLGETGVALARPGDRHSRMLE